MIVKYMRQYGNIGEGWMKWWKIGLKNGKKNIILKFQGI